MLSVAEVYQLADAITPRYRALVLLATFGDMRRGELAGLRRRNLDLDGRSVRVVETVYEFGQLVKGTPKSAASARKIPLLHLYAREERGQQIAATLDKMARRELSRARKRHREDQAGDEATGTEAQEGLLRAGRTPSCWCCRQSAA